MKAIAVATLFALLPASAPLLSKDQPAAAPPKVIGHRGARAHHPESSFVGFATAIERGGWIELDVRETADRVLVVHHDPVVNFNQCEQLQGPPIPPGTAIKDLTYAELRWLDCGSKPDPGFPGQLPSPGEPIWQLGTILSFAASKDSHVLVELKADDDHLPPAEFVDDVAREVTSALARRHVTLMSFDPALVRAAQNRMPLVPTALLIGPHAPDDPIAMTVRVGARGAAVVVPLVDADLVRRGHGVNRSIYVWTANDSPTWDALTRMGVDGIITDDPLTLLDRQRNR